MRKSTVAALAMILLLGGVMLFTFKTWTGQFVEEVKNGKDLTRRFQSSVRPGTTVKLLRVYGSDRYLVTDRASPGLLLEASPTEEVLAKDKTAFPLARDLATRCLESYGPERPARWVEFHLFRPDGTRIPSFTLVVGESGGGFALIEGPKPK